MAPLPFPTVNGAEIGLSQVSFHLLNQTDHFPSPLNQAERVRAGVNPRWTGTLTTQDLKEVEWRAWTAFLAELEGAAGRFLYSPRHAPRPRGGIQGAPTVAGAAQTGRQLTTAGWNPNVTVLQRGDFFSFASGDVHELKIVTSDAASDGAGAATVKFGPPIRRAPADGAVLTIDKPLTVMRLVDDRQGETRFRHRRVIAETVSITVLESFL